MSQATGTDRTAREWRRSLFTEPSFSAFILDFLSSSLKVLPASIALGISHCQNYTSEESARMEAMIVVVTKIQPDLLLELNAPLVAPPHDVCP